MISLFIYIILTNKTKITWRNNMTRVAYPGIADAQPPPTLKDGPHELIITKAYRKESKTFPGTDNTEIVIVDQNEPDANAIFFYLVDPISLETFIERKPDKSEEDYTKSENFKALNVKQFCKAFDIEFDEAGYELDDFLGKRATLMTTSEKDEKTGRVNVSIQLPPVV